MSDATPIATALPQRMGSNAGQRTTRRDGVLKVTGTATYAADNHPQGLLHAVFACATIARGRVTDLDVAAAKAHPGVVEVMTPANRPPLSADPDSKPMPFWFRTQVFQDDRVLYAGQPIALVLAETLEAATEGAARLSPRYAAEAPRIGLDEPPYAPKAVGIGAPAKVSKGDIEAGLAAAAQRLEVTIETPAQYHNAMEPHAVVAEWQGDRLIIDTPNQAPVTAAAAFAAWFGIAPQNVLLRTPFLGGGFGSTAGGSSGGAAAALAARLLPVADGSDMMGSLRNPAAYCNVYGMRPSYGLVPQDPLGDTFLHQLSTDGPMARNVEDMAALLETLSQPDPRLPHRIQPEPFTQALDTDPRGLRIGWLGDWGGAYRMEPGILDLCETAQQTFTEMGCEVTPLPPPFPAEKLWHSWTTLRSWAVAARLGIHHADPARRALLKPEAIWEIERGLSLSAMEAHRASVIRSDWCATAAGLFETFDALILPSAQLWPFDKTLDWPHAIGDRAMDSYHRGMEVVVPVSLIGLPAISVPAGFGAEGLPMGMQLIGPRGGDRALLRLAQAWHRATDWPGRRPPAL